MCPPMSSMVIAFITFLHGWLIALSPRLSYFPQEVHYSREGQEGVPQNTLKVFRFVKEAFVIPDDFDKNHRVSAYCNGALFER